MNWLCQDQEIRCSLLYCREGHISYQPLGPLLIYFWDSKDWCCSCAKDRAPAEVFFCVHESVTHTKRLRTIPVSCVAIGVFRSSFMLLSYCLLHLILLRMMFVSGHDGLQLAWFTTVSSDTRLLHLILLRMMFVSGHDGLQLAWFTAVSSDTQLLHLILLRMMFVSGHDGLQLAWFTAVSSDTHSAVTSDRSTRLIHIRHTPTGLHNNWQKSAAYLSCELWQDWSFITHISSIFCT